MNTKFICAAALLLASTTALPTTAEAAETSSSTTQIIALPLSAGSGEGKEVSILLDERHLKLATIALRRGTPLPSHSAPVPVTIQVLEGDGIIHAAGKALTVSKGAIISLAPGADHDVVPRQESDMLLLVHYLRTCEGEAKEPTSEHPQ